MVRPATLAGVIQPSPLPPPESALASYVASHALRVDGPIREYYLVGWHDTADESAWRTEVCWPIFSTGPALAS